jgi:4-alpha-glucanotransferase
VEADLRRGAPARIEVAMALEPARCQTRTNPRDGGDPGHSFVVRRDRDGAAGASIIAGYPWFADWGRDAMIALPGLLLRSGRCADAAIILRTFAAHLRNGLLPNCFDDGGAGASYNGADSSLWFVRAVRATATAAGDMDLSDLVDACRAIVRAYQAGTDYGIRVDDEGLVVADAHTASGDDVPVTWMDARRGGVTFTSRAGRPIELSALWHHAQLALADMAGGAEADALRSEAARTASSIRARFWWPERRCLYDVLCGSAAWGDGRMRPNQIFAVSLAPSPLDPGQQRDVVAAVTARLLTPFGLRTLDPDDPAYRGRFEGDLMQRDGAYHHGTVWPWLIGAWGEAVLRTEGFAHAARDRVRAALAPLLDAMDAASEEGGCFGQIAEVYDGDPPHRPGGCPAQAWSVAEVLRLRALLES